MIFAIDFDGTIFKWSAFPDIGEPVPGAIETLKELKASGHTLVLWTCRTGDALQMAIDKLIEHGLEFDHHNECPDQEHLSVKLDADVFIDDKALGCPLVPNIHEGRYKPFVDWASVNNILRPYMGWK